MKSLPLAAVCTAVVVLAAGSSASAQIARFRYQAAVYADDQGAGLKEPEGVACDAKGGVVIADTGNDRVLRFTYRDGAWSGGSEIKHPQLTAPSGVQLDSKGGIYALDGKKRRIVHLGADGTFKGAIAFAGVPPPSTIVPKSFRIDAADHLYVLDVFSARVLVLNAAGQFQRSIPFPEDTGFVSDLAVDQAGTVFLLDSVKRQVHAAARDAAGFSPLGKDLTPSLSAQPTSISTSKGLIFIVEASRGSIVSLGRDGTFLARQLSNGRLEGALGYPSQVCINDRNEAFVAERDNSRVQVFGIIR
jgi:sugar lactone lactonase YvrE